MKDKNPELVTLVKFWTSGNGQSCEIYIEMVKRIKRILLIRRLIILSLIPLGLISFIDIFGPNELADFVQKPIFVYPPIGSLLILLIISKVSYRDSEFDQAAELIQDIHLIQKMCSRGEPLKFNDPSNSSIFKNEISDQITQFRLRFAYNTNWAIAGREILRRRGKNLAQLQLLLGADHKSNIEERNLLREDFELMKRFLFEHPRTPFSELFEVGGQKIET